MSADLLAPLLLGLAVIGCYLAVDWARRLVGGGLEAAWAFPLPLAAITLVATGWGRSEIAMGAILGAALATLGLLLPLVMFQSRPKLPAPAAVAGWWPLLIPATVATLLVGLSAVIDWKAAAALAALAMASLPLALARRRENALSSGRRGVLEGSDAGDFSEEDIRAGHVGLKVARGGGAACKTVGTDAGVEMPDAAGRSHASVAVADAGPSLLWRGLRLGGLVVVLGATGWAAIYATLQLSARSPFAPTGLFGACILGPASCLPLLGATTAAAERGKTYIAISACVRHCLILLLIGPLVVFGVGVERAGFDWQVVVPFPGTLWRVETILLIALSAMLVPVAAGRLIPQHTDGLVILIVYVGYLLLSAISGLRLRG